MAAQVLRFVSAFFLLSLFSAAYSDDSFPSISEIVSAYYQTEVLITDVKQKTSAYVTSYFNSIDHQGAVKLYFQGDQTLIYFDNSTYEITTVSGSSCNATDLDLSEFAYNPIYYGWLNKKPIMIGPTAPLWYAQGRKNDIVKSPKKFRVRSVRCDKYTLKVQNNEDDLTYEYYFAESDWTTPYKYKSLRVPVRIKISGTSSRYSAEGKNTTVEQINDFAYFKPSIDDLNSLLPPIGIGCLGKKKTDYMPDIPKVFQYSAEVVDVLKSNDQEDIEIQFQKTWYDHTRLIARRDGYSRLKGFKSQFYDFNTGTLYKIVDDGSCEMAILRDTDFQTYDYGMTSLMKEPKQALNLDGDFYDMGRRTIRGLRCDVFESVQLDKHFQGRKYSKLVVTAYFADSETNIGINGEMESRIPIYYIINGWETPEKKTLQLQYNIFAFDDVIWPEMYVSFRLDRCYVKADSKAYFVLLMPVNAETAAQMEAQNEAIIAQLRSSIAVNARVPEMRIPFLKADYKPSGVFVTGLMLERPPASLQFYDIDSGPTTTNDPDLKVIPGAENVEECSYACVDEPDFPCKGFYFCGRACFLKSSDPFDVDDKTKTQDLGDCTEYIRGEIESTNFRQKYLMDALGYLDQSVIDGNLTIAFQIPNGEEIVKVSDCVIGDGPYIGDDSGDKPFSVSIELRKLDNGFETTTPMEYAGSLHDCYKRCKEAGSLCSSFSYCPDSKSDNKECMVSSELIIKGVTKDTDLVPDKNCNIYNLKYSDYFIPYQEKVSLLPGDKVLKSIEALEKCAASCRMEKSFVCRGFEYCKSKKVCTLHKKHILELKPGETTTSAGKECIHYAARYIVDFMDMGGALIDDNSNVKYGTSLEECAQICTEDLKTNCKSFNFCQRDDEKGTDSTCALSTKLLREDGITTTEKGGCKHYEKRDSVHDWDKSQTKPSPTGYTKKGFAGLIVGMIALGIIVGALGFIFYSYMRSRKSGEGMGVRFMKNES